MEARTLSRLVDAVLPLAWRRESPWHGEEHWRCVAATGLDVPEREPEAPPAPVPAIEVLDLRREDVTTVLWANGFRPDHAWVEGVEVDAQGWPLQDRGASPVPGLYFVGLHWLHKRKSSLFLGVGEDAEHVAAAIAGRAA